MHPRIARTWLLQSGPVFTMNGTVGESFFPIPRQSRLVTRKKHVSGIAQLSALGARPGGNST